MVMKQAFFFFLVIAWTNAVAQGGTEVYWTEVSAMDKTLSLTNLSQNPGYDNQPFFWSEEVLLYTATRNGQTDILKHNLKTNTKEWLCATAQGSEYSPLRIPETETFSAIRLDTTGLQRLYRYATTGESQRLFADLKIGYHVWMSPTTIVCTVLVEDRMDLYLAVPQSGKARRIAQNIGRSLHRIPQTSSVSFLQWEGETATLTAYDLQSEEKKALVVLPSGVQDMAWLPNGELLYGKGSVLYSQFLGQAARVWHTFSARSIKNISRVAVSPSGKRIALVGEE